MDSILALREMGLSAGTVAICVSLCIWNSIQIKALQRSSESLVSVLSKIAEDQAKASEQLAVVAANLINLTSSVNQVMRDLITVVRDVER